jgi:hypothetical protein
MLWHMGDYSTSNSKCRLPRGAIIGAFASMALAFAVPSGAYADTIDLSLNTGNTAIAGYPGPYGDASINLTSSTTALITFTSNSSGGYLFGDGGSADLNVNGTYTLGAVTVTGLTGFSPSYKNNTPGTADGFGYFSLSLNLNDGYAGAANTISFTITDTSGTWTTAADVLTPNSNGNDVAAHIFVCGLTSGVCNAGVDALATGYATAVSAVPEPSTWGMMLLGFLGLGFAFRHQSRRKVSFA